ASVVRTADAPVSPPGGLRLLQGRLGRAVIKVSAVKPEHRIVEAPAIVFETQEAFLEAFKAGELERDFVAVMRFQGPRANGMPELHSLSPGLSVLQDRGFKVALVTDGRMSGASGKTPAAIHVSPEALAGGPLARVRDGDLIRLNAETGELSVTPQDGDFDSRPLATPGKVQAWGLGRELFGVFRTAVGSAEEGASVCFTADYGQGQEDHVETNVVDHTVDA
ncbi:MAG: dihydroxy-acid dehydratase, partial [Brevundimonas sp.]